MPRPLLIPFSSYLYLPVLTHQYQLEGKVHAPREVPPLDSPQPPARYPVPGDVLGTAPSFPAGQMNGIGPGGQPAYYGLVNPLSPTNGVPGPPSLPPQPLFPGMEDRPPLGYQERHPNGASQNHSPIIVPSSQPQGGPQQPLASSIGPLGPTPHTNRASFPPPTGPQHPQDPGSVGFAHPTPSAAHQQLVRLHGTHDISSQNYRSTPPLSGPLPPSHEQSHTDVAHTSFPADDVGKAKMRGGFGDKEAQSLTAGEVGHYPPRSRLSNI